MNTSREPLHTIGARSISTATPLMKVCAVLIGAGLICLSISNASFWIDEAFSWTLVHQPTFADFLQIQHNLPPGWSEPLMPGFHLYLWLWCKVFGFSEVAMRLSNTLWAGLFVAAVAAAGSFLRSKISWLVLALSPFVGFYANEARPYLMMMALSATAVACTVAFLSDPKRYKTMPAWTIVTVLLLWTCHLLAITVVPSLLVLILLRSNRDNLRAWLIPTLCGIPFAALLLAYFMGILRHSPAAQMERPGLQNLVYAVYEMLGFSGLGPPRNDMRHLSKALLLHYTPYLLLGVLMLVVLAVTCRLALRRERDAAILQALLIAFTVGMLLAFGAAWFAHFRILGRHMAVFAPFLLISLLFLFPRQDQAIPRSLAIASVGLVIFTWTVSDLRDRFVSRYQKDDYRDAVSFAKAKLAENFTVSWMADTVTADYYSLPTDKGLAEDPIDPTAAHAGVCNAQRLQSLIETGRPNIVVTTDREPVDPGGACHAILFKDRAKQITEFNNFVIWEVPHS